MAIFRANLAGEITQLLVTQQEINQNPPGEDVAYSLTFDPDTNEAIIAAYSINSSVFAMIGGTLTQSGIPVTINAPSLLHTALSNLPILIAKLQTGDSFTTSELKQLLTVLLRGTGHI